MQVTFKSVAAIALFMTLSAKSFSQTNKFSLSFNSLTTNFHYGKSEGALEPYKKNFRGLQAGIAYQAGITPRLSVVPELYFAMKGGTLEENNPLTENKTTLRLYSVEMPVLARLHFNNFYINAGPYAGYITGGRLKTEGSDGVSGTSTKVSFENAANGFNRLDYGVLAGAGYNFTIKRTSLTLDARYGYGLANISKGAERYNRMLNISLVASKPYKRKK